MEKQIFSDGIGQISVIGGVVRLDLMTYSATELDAKGQPRAVLTQRVVMGVDGFLRASEKILEAAQKIARANQPPQLKPQPTPVSSTPPAPAPPPPAQPQPRAEPAAPQPQLQPHPQPVRAPEPPPQPDPSPWSAPPPKRPFP